MEIYLSRETVHTIFDAAVMAYHASEGQLPSVPPSREQQERLAKLVEDVDVWIDELGPREDND